MSTRTRIGIIGLVVTGVLVGLITLTAAESGSFHSPLAKAVRIVLGQISPGTTFSGRDFNFVTNVLMFMPLGFFTGLVLPDKKWWVGFLALPATSALIEGVQIFLPTRGTQLADFVANSLGGWIGLLLASALIMATAGRRKRSPQEELRVEQTIGWVGFGLTTLLVALITLTPQSPTSAHSRISGRILYALHSLGVPESFGPIQWELTANIIMFKPLGFFLALILARRGPWLGVLILPLMSVFIECFQWAFLPSRYPSIQDIVANSVGGWIGLAIGWVALWLWDQRPTVQTVK